MARKKKVKARSKPKKVKAKLRKAKPRPKPRRKPKPKPKAKPRKKGRAFVKAFPPLPKGFGRLDPRPEIQGMLERSAREMKHLHGYDSDIKHAINADKSVSYEVRYALPSRWNPQYVLTDLVNTLRSLPGTWISIGFRFRPGTLSPEEAENYDRYRGMTQVQCYTRRTSRRRLAGLEATAEDILKNVQERRGWKAEVLFVRVHWTKTGERPPKAKNLKR